MPITELIYPGAGLTDYIKEMCGYSSYGLFEPGTSTPITVQCCLPIAHRHLSNGGVHVGLTPSGLVVLFEDHGNNPCVFTVEK